MLLSKLKLFWHTTNSDKNWSKLNVKKESIAFIISEYIKYNSLLTSSAENKALFPDYYKILIKSAKNIRQKNKEPYIYFESKENGIKHTKFFLDTDAPENYDFEYQRCHQLSQRRIMSHFLERKINISNIEFFTLLIWLAENSCIYAARNYTKYRNDIIKNNDLELSPNYTSLFDSDFNLNYHTLYSKVYDNNTGDLVVNEYCWKKFDVFRSRLSFLCEELISISFSNKNANEDMFDSIFADYSDVISEVDSSTYKFATTKAFLEIKEIVLHNA